MNVDQITNLVAQTVAQVMSGTQTAQDEVVIEVSEEQKKAQAEKEASLNQDAKIIAEKVLGMMDELGFTIDILANLNTQWGKAGMFSYNSSRSAWEKACERKAYWESQPRNEIAMDRLDELERTLEDLEARMEQNQLINYASSINAQTLYARFKQERLDAIQDHEQKGYVEGNYLKYNMVETISEATYSAFRNKKDAEFANKQKRQRQVGVAAQQQLYTTERKFQVTQ